VERKFDDVLLCPVCRNSGVSRRENSYICDSCKSIYPDYEGITTIIQPEERKEDYGKLLVIEKKNKFRKYEAKWDEVFSSFIDDGEGLFLDFGCGRGRKNWVEAKGYDYIGLDYYLDYGVNLLANGRNIPIKNNTVSICISHTVMEHIPNPWAVCDELFRVLKPNGLYVGSTAFLYPFHERSHYNMSHLGVKHMLEQSGFVVEKIVPWKISGIEALVRVLFCGRFLKQVAGYFVRVQFNLIMYMRKVGAKFVSLFYLNNAAKSERIFQFIEEEPLRFTSGFTYVARKPNEV